MHLNELTTRLLEIQKNKTPDSDPLVQLENKAGTQVITSVELRLIAGQKIVVIDTKDKP